MVHLCRSLLFILVLALIHSCVTKEMIVEFDADSRDIQLLDSVKFFNNSTGCERFVWEFGDGANSTMEHPSHLFKNPGDYHVKLTGWKGNTKKTTELKIIVRDLKIEVNIDKDKVSRGEIISVTSKIDREIIWKLDGVNITESYNFEQELRRVGNNTLEMYDKKTGIVLFKKMIEVIDSGEPPPPPPPIVLIKISPVETYVNGEVTISTTYDKEFKWDLGNGTTSENKSVAVSYDNIGEKKVVLIDKITGKELESKTVTVGSPRIFISPAKVYLNRDVTFSTNYNKEVKWDLDDGISSDERIATIKYAKTGSKKVTMYDKSSGKELNQKTVEVKIPPVTSSIRPLSAFTEDEIEFFCDAEFDI